MRQRPSHTVISLRQEQERHALSNEGRASQARSSYTFTLSSRLPKTTSEMILLGLVAVVKVGILVVATVVFLAVYGFLLDRLERRGP